MHLDKGETDSQKGVAECDGGVREGRWIYNEPLNATIRCGRNEIYDLPFMIRLKGLEGDAELTGQIREIRIHLGEGRCAIGSRLSLPQEMQIRPVDDGDFDHL
jgi:hypothetical protein